MAVVRDDPYGRFNFLVALGDGAEGEVVGGFHEVSRIRSTLEVTEYRNGNDRAGQFRKVTGLAKVADVTLKRGVIGSLDAFRWFADTRDAALVPRTVTVTLLDEVRQPVMTWRLVRARPVRYGAGPLRGTSSGVAIEELTLAYERLEVE
jgi:phage tail-like protein